MLDLGLAKALVGEISGDAPSLLNSPTITSAGTVAGTVLGTAAYMSPEQAKARPIDRRADVWAFGCVFYEMLTGKRAFDGDGISEVLAAVLRDEVDWDALPAETPATARYVLRRCLDRNVRMRLRDIGEARVALSSDALASSITEGPTTTSAAPAPAARGRERIAWAIAFAAVAAAAFAGWVAVQRARTPPLPEVRAAIRPPEGQVFDSYGSHAGSVSISPDGTRMTFGSSAGSGGRPVLHLRTLGSEVARPVPGTEGATYPFWSPDGRNLAFFADGKLKRLDLDGGAPMTICSAPAGRGGTWSKNGVIVFAEDAQAPISRVSASGGEPTPVTTVDGQRKGETTHRYPYFLPGGNHFLFLRAGHAAALEDEVNSLWIGSLDGDEPIELMRSVSNAAYAMGHLFYVRDQFLMAQPFDAAKLQFSAEPFAVGEGVVFESGYWRGAFAVAENGFIAYQGGLGRMRLLKWFDRDGNELGQIGQAAQYGHIRLSPDDRQLAATISDPHSGRGDIWTFDVTRNVASRLTFSDGHDSRPVWSPDGKRIAFVSNREGESGDVYVVSANGRGKPEPLLKSEVLDAPTDWSSDDRYVSINRGLGKTDLWLVPLDGTEPFSLVSTEFDEGYARFSPDGKWIAYLSNQSGRYELYLTRVPTGEGKWQLTAEGADWVLGWKEDGREIYYLDLEGALNIVRVELGDKFVADRPQRLYRTRSENTWDSTRDGQRFILGTPENPSEGYPITLIVNWAGKR